MISNQKIEIQKYLISLIQEKLKPGDIMPSEKAISIKFDVGRSISREVLKNLESNHIIKSQKNKGYYVTNFFEYAINSDRKRNVSTRVLEVENIADKKNILNSISIKKIISWKEKINVKNFTVIEKHYISENLIVNSTSILFSKEHFDNINFEKISKSFISYLKTESNLVYSLNDIDIKKDLNNDPFVRKTSVFLDMNNSIIAISCSKIKLASYEGKYIQTFSK